MKKTTVKKSELLEILKSNREDHKKQADAAKEGHREDFIKELEEAIELAKNPDNKLPEHIKLAPVVDHTSIYDSAIKRLEMEIEDNIELEGHEFDQLVMDDWHWKDDFRMSNARYIK